ncbi:MAG: GAF domain-containing protein [Desulfobacteraceae bacterium]|nr:GAF domain-containing protein [Desulfobacteraceae bacterium]
MCRNLSGFSHEKFNSFIKAMAKYDEIDLLVNYITEEICKEFDCMGCCIMLFDDRENQLFQVGSFGLSDEYLKKGPVNVNIDYETRAREEPILINDLEKDSRIQYLEEALKENIKAILFIPVKSRKSIVGEIRIYHNESIDIEDADLNLFCLLGQFLGLMIENQGLKNFLGEVKLAMGNLPLRLLDRI